MNYWCDWVSIRYISSMICITIFMEEVRVFLIFIYVCIPCFEEKLMWAFLSLVNFLSWLHDGFMCIVNDILHSMFDSKQSRLYWGIHVATETHDETLKIIASMDSDVNDSTNSMIEISSMLFINFFELFSNDICSHEYCLLKWYVHWKGWVLVVYLIFCLCSPIFPNNIFHDVICLVNTNSMFTSNNLNVDGL